MASSAGLLAAFRVPSRAALRTPMWSKDVVVSAPKRVAAYRKRAGGAATEYGRELLPPRYREPPAGADLNEGVEAYAGRPEEYRPDTTEALLRALRESAGAEAAGETVRGVRVVTYRNSLNHIMACPYADEPWQIGAWMESADGPLRLEMEEYDGPQAPDARPPMPRDKQLMFDYWGRRFEALATEGDGRVSLEDELCVVNTMRLGRQKVMVGAEVDCWTEGRSGRPELVELKTTRAMDTLRHHSMFQKRKLLKWWIQSFLGGVPRIVAGMRDDRGRLLGVERIDTLRIPGLARRGLSAHSPSTPVVAERRRATWNANACLVFTDQLLDWAVREVSTRAAPGRRFQLRFEPPFREVRLVRAPEEEAVAPADAAN